MDGPGFLVLSALGSIRTGTHYFTRLLYGDLSNVGHVSLRWWKGDWHSVFPDCSGGQLGGCPPGWFLYRACSSLRT
ncbi:hypothetical protein Tco_0924437 [Tanacetum coccineum]|uniref:Secreted protein n=1 Tax=Tanacetum coccineum TaxID=301880 RepID=A0ABQ5D6W3_9ASTR